MRPAAAAFAALLAAGASALELSAAGLALSRGSLPQVLQVLEQVRASAEEAGHRAEHTGAETQARCNEVLERSAEQAAVAGLVQRRLQSDIEEQDAAVEEAAGNTDQVRANIQLVEHTLVQVKKAAHISPALVENKARTLDSLRGELSIMLPAFAQLRSRAAEAGRRLDDHTRSSDAVSGLWKAVRQACSLSSDRAAELVSRSTSQLSAMDEVLSALKPLAGAKPAAAAPAALSEEDDEEAAAPSLMQLARAVARGEDDDDSADQDLISLFGSESRGSGGRTPEVPQPPQPAAEDDHGGFLDLMPKVKQLLAELRSEGQPGAADSKRWCREERARAALSRRAVGAAARELAAEAGAHAEAAAQAQEDLARINGTVSLVQDAASRVTASINAERKAAGTATKDQKLASKILDQAAAILSETPSVSGAAGHAVVASVQAAAAAFAPERSSAAALLQLGDALSSMLRLANQSLAHLAAERSHLELARDSHATLQARTLESKGLYDAELASTEEYLKKLDERCSAGAAAPVQRERAAEIRALSDAQLALAGQALQAPVADSQGSLRGGASSNALAASQRNLSPLERAAAEMGVAVDAA